MPFRISGESFLNLQFFHPGELLIAAAVGPSVAPPVPGGKRRGPANLHAKRHGFRQALVAGPRQHAFAEGSIGPDSFVGTSPLPIGKVMGLAAVAPFVPDLERAVGKKAATVTGKGDEARSVGRTATDA